MEKRLQFVAWSINTLHLKRSSKAKSMTDFNSHKFLKKETKRPQVHDTAMTVTADYIWEDKYYYYCNIYNAHSVSNWTGDSWTTDVMCTLSTRPPTWWMAVISFCWHSRTQNVLPHSVNCVLQRTLDTVCGSKFQVVGISNDPQQDLFLY